MPYWEYKVITSGKGGFATPALLEKFLNDLGRDEWEIIHYQTPPDNLLAFTGLARRSTQRDWTLEDAAAAAAKVEAEKLRAEFEAKFKAASSPARDTVEERPASFLEEKSAPDDGLRKLVDTSQDADPEAQEDEKTDEWDKLTATEEEELPSFFEAIRPHLRRNQRGPGMSVVRWRSVLAEHQPPRRTVDQHEGKTAARIPPRKGHARRARAAQGRQRQRNSARRRRSRP
jgi:hypothetical protein